MMKIYSHLYVYQRNAKTQQRRRSPWTLLPLANSAQNRQTGQLIQACSVGAQSSPRVQGCEHMTDTPDDEYSDDDRVPPSTEGFTVRFGMQSFDDPEDALSEMAHNCRLGSVTASELWASERA
jgi:hypothetical protein